MASRTRRFCPQPCTGYKCHLFSPPAPVCVYTIYVPSFWSRGGPAQRSHCSSICAKFCRTHSLTSSATEGKKHRKNPVHSEINKPRFEPQRKPAATMTAFRWFLVHSKMLQPRFSDPSANRRQQGWLYIPLILSWSCFRGWWNPNYCPAIWFAVDINIRFRTVELSDGRISRLVTNR